MFCALEASFVTWGHIPASRTALRVPTVAVAASLEFSELT